MHHLTAAALSSAVLAAAGAQDAPPAQAPVAATPVEFGAVAWGRDFDAGLARVRATNAPMLLLFTEVPG